MTASPAREEPGKDGRDDNMSTITFRGSVDNLYNGCSFIGSFPFASLPSCGKRFKSAFGSGATDKLNLVVVHLVFIYL